MSDFIANFQETLTYVGVLMPSLLTGGLLRYGFGYPFGVPGDVAL